MTISPLPVLDGLDAAPRAYVAQRVRRRAVVKSSASLAATLVMALLAVAVAAFATRPFAEGLNVAPDTVRIVAYAFVAALAFSSFGDVRTLLQRLGVHRSVWEPLTFLCLALTYLAVAGGVAALVFTERVAATIGYTPDQVRYVAVGFVAVFLAATVQEWMNAHRIWAGRVADDFDESWSKEMDCAEQDINDVLSQVEITEQGTEGVQELVNRYLDLTAEVNTLHAARSGLQAIAQ